MTKTCLGVISFCLLAAPALGTWLDDIGYTALQAELGTAMPTGAGIEVTQVEMAATGSQYLPSTTSPEFTNKVFTDKTGGGATSTHATTVGTFWYGGISGIAPAVNVIDCYESDNWLGMGFLRTSSQAPPGIESRRVQNLSWIDHYLDDLKNSDALARLDQMIDRDGVVVCASVNNYNPADPATREMPKLMCSAYNCIAVGRMDGNSSYGPTVSPNPYRYKPDLVATASAPETSYATAVTSASAALLLEVEDRTGILMDLGTWEKRSAKALLTKTLLMGGAVKPADWRKGASVPRTDGGVPLDYRYGAGNLNIANSYHLLVAGQQRSSSTTLVSTQGWDYDHATVGNRYYFFRVPVGQVATTLSVMLVWNRRFPNPPDLDHDDDVDADDFTVFAACFTGPTVGPYAIGCAEADLDGDSDVDLSDLGVFQACMGHADVPPQKSCRKGTANMLANFDLRLYAAAGFSLGALRDKSISSYDNVEHIYLQNVAAGDWAIAVSTDRAWPYAITWDASLVPAAP